ncbi:MAG: ImmA/IrrE family metallo-endopeptidase [Hyphomonadaceae bacterium]|nr:ImmA/IrrE family metallo-endopeptidase [Hyphomonadaceae bacterium]
MMETLVRDRAGALWAKVDQAEREIVERFIGQRPVKVGELAEALGIKVTRSPMAPRISGLIRRSAATRSGFEIAVNKYEMPERQRFTVAHEIGHYLLHRNDIGAEGVVDSIMYRSNLGSRKETEANQIASAIVMPAEILSGDLAELGGLGTPGIVEELAERYRVSEPAMRIRLGMS